MSCLRALLSYFTRPTVHLIMPSQNDRNKAESLVQILLHAEKSGTGLTDELERAVKPASWTESLALALYEQLQAALESGARMNTAMADAVDRAADAARQFATEHPVQAALIVLGVLCLLAPWVLEALGFAVEGIVEGSFAARWMAQYGGYVPKGSLFSFLQSMGMRLHWALPVVPPMAAKGNF